MLVGLIEAYVPEAIGSVLLVEHETQTLAGPSSLRVESDGPTV